MCVVEFIVVYVFVRHVRESEVYKNNKIALLLILRVLRAICSLLLYPQDLKNIVFIIMSTADHRHAER